MRMQPGSTLFPYTTLFRSTPPAKARSHCRCSKLWQARHTATSEVEQAVCTATLGPLDRKSTRLNSSHPSISYAVFCLKKKKQRGPEPESARHRQRSAERVP